MRPLLAVVDYGMGNLLSIEKALEAAGAEVRRADSEEGFQGADGLVLPGVGNFGKASENLSARGLMSPLKVSLRAGRPFLGICLGFQLLFEGSEEAPKRPGLAFLPGRVVKFRNSPRVPHMGWSQVTQGGSEGVLVARRETSDERRFYYFVHSYFPVPKDQRIVSTRTRYGSEFASSIAWGNSFACQFHPEKSGENGLRLLGNFIRQIDVPC